MKIVSVMGMIFYFSHQDGDVSRDVSKQVVSKVEDAKEEMQGEETNIEDAKEKQGFHLKDVAYVFLACLMFVMKLGVRNLAHIFLYWFLGIAIFLVMKDEVRIQKKFCWGMVFCLLYSISDEVHQIFIPGRDFRIEDLLMDAVGYAVALGLCHGVAKWNSIWIKRHSSAIDV